MSNDQNQKKNVSPEKTDTAPSAAAKADYDERDAELAELKAKVAELEGRRTLPAAPPLTPLTEANAKEPVLIRVKHGVFVGTTADGKTFTDDKPAPMGSKFRVSRACAYAALPFGSVELV